MRHSIMSRINSCIARLLMICAVAVIGENLKCKARTGCHFSGCDPGPVPSSVNLERNEFPITCEQTGLTAEIERLTLANAKLQDDLSKFVAETNARFQKLETPAKLESPVKQTLYSKKFHCDFNTAGNICGMKNRVGQKHNWEQKFGKPAEKYIKGQYFDISKTFNDKDGYLYSIIKPSWDFGTLSNSVIDSPKFSPGYYCLKFRTLMTSLEVDAMIYSDIANKAETLFERIWWIIGGSNLWKNYELDLVASGENVTSVDVSFTNVDYVTVESLAIIDDITIELGKCRNN